MQCKRFVMLAADPTEGTWAVIAQSNEANVVLDAQDSLKRQQDQSGVIILDTSQFVIFQ